MQFVLLVAERTRIECISQGVFQAVFSEFNSAFLADTMAAMELMLRRSLQAGDTQIVRLDLSRPFLKLLQETFAGLAIWWAPLDERISNQLDNHGTYFLLAGFIISKG
jgi:hypothetical protein